MLDTKHPPASWTVSALARAGYGARPEDIAVLASIGFPAWVDAQLRPREDQDIEVRRRLENLALRLKYGAPRGNAGSPKAAPAADATGSARPPMDPPARDEMLPLQYLDRPIDQAWPLVVNRKTMDGAERRRPADEVVAATLLRAVHSRWQLREVMVAFWHDHFNVDARGVEEVAVALPTYDRDVIRPHALGNFRAFLEAVATSTAMLYYLSNRSSRAGSANENYGRELFELHTLGRDAYLNDRYDRWRTVPGALKGAPAGYIDEDVYESARAFTGWTVEDGSAIDGQRKLPATGRFAYVEAWHDGYQKRVLAHEFQEFRPAMADGRAVLDLVASHPATAQFIATKLVRRFVADDPPKRLVAAAAATFAAKRHAEDQIAQTVRAILLSPEFAASQGAKVRRPMALAAAYARAAGIDFTPAEPVWAACAAAGQKLFGWPTPTGTPDQAGYFLGANSMRQRWAMLLALSDDRWKTGPVPVPPALLDRPVTPRSVAQHYLGAMHGGAEEAAIEAVLAGQVQPADRPWGDPERPEVQAQIARLSALAAMTPRFQTA